MQVVSGVSWKVILAYKCSYLSQILLKIKNEIYSIHFGITLLSNNNKYLISNMIQRVPILLLKCFPISPA